MITAYFFRKDNPYKLKAIYMSNRNEKRISYLDFAKGIAIICIVIGHSYSYHVGNGKYIIPYLYSFHVPAFFVISGIIYYQRSTVQLNVLKKGKELLIPYFLWGTMYQLILCALSVYGGANPRDQIRESLSAVLQLTSGAMWFLPTMFISSVLFQLSCKIQNKAVHILLSILAFSAGVIAPRQSILAESVWRGLSGFFFISAGYYLSTLFTHQVRWPIWLLLLFADLILIQIYGTADLARRSFGFVPLYVAVSLLGSWLCVSASHYLESILTTRSAASINRLGRFSIVVLCTHQIVLTFLQLLDYKLLNNRIQRTGELEGIFMGCIIVLIIYMIMPFLLRALGWSFGIKNKSTERKINT